MVRVLRLFFFFFFAIFQCFFFSGGNDLTSFAYFRLLQRLNAGDGQSKAIRVPGSFADANFAVPLACDPISSLVLSNLCVGLFSEAVTGTPLAPLAEIGENENFYFRAFSFLF